MSAARLATPVALVTLAALAVSPAVAQTSAGFFRPVSASPAGLGYGYYGYGHSSTALEGALRGRAEVIQALGTFRLLDSQAKILDEQARSLAYENDVKRTETLYRKQYLWQQHRDETRARQIERDAVGKELLAQRQATYYREAYRLDSDELNRMSGKLTWPASLREDTFASTRSQLNFLFQQRSRYAGGGGDPFAERILKLTDQLKQDLKDHLADMDPTAYSEAQKFVRGLMYEVQYPSELG